MENLKDKSMDELEQMKLEKQTLHKKLLHHVSVSPTKIKQQKEEIERLKAELEHKREAQGKDRELYDRVKEGGDHLEKKVRIWEEEIENRLQQTVTEGLTDDERREVEEILEAEQEAGQGMDDETESNQVSPSTAEPATVTTTSTILQIESTKEVAVEVQGKETQDVPNDETKSNQALPSTVVADNPATKTLAPDTSSSRQKSTKEEVETKSKLLQWFKDHLEKEEWILRSTGVKISGADATTRIKTKALTNAFEAEFKAGTMPSDKTDDDLDVDFSCSPLSPHRLTKNFNRLFGKDSIKSIRGEYIIPDIATLRRQFKIVAMGDAE
jgi:uncharacterized small protein (DUF1192 family)